MKRLQSYLLIIVCFLSFAALPAAGKPGEFSASFQGEGGRPAGWDFDTTDQAFWRQEDGWLTSGSGSDIATTDGYSFGTIETVDSASWRDYTVSCRFWMKAPNGRMALIGRWKDRNNHYRAVIGIGAGKRVLRLEKIEAGEITMLASKDLDLPALGISQLENGTKNDTVLLQMRMAGSSIAVAINSKPLLTATDTTFPNGTAGIGEYRNEIFFDDVKVAQLSLEESSIVAPTAAKGKIFSVQVFNAADLDIARTIVRQLSLKGYPVFLDQADGTYQVFVGEFSDPKEARKFQQMMIVSEDFSFAKVVDVSANQTVAKAPTPTTTEKESIQQSMERVFADLDWDMMRPDQQQKVLDMVVRRSALRNTFQSADGIQSMKEEVNRMTSEQKETLVKLEERIAKESSTLGTKTSDLANQISNMYSSLTNKVSGEVKATINAEMKIERDKLRIRVDSLEEKQNEAQNQPVAQASATGPNVQNIIYGALGALFLLIIIVFFILRRYKKMIVDMQEGGFTSLPGAESQAAGMITATNQMDAFPGDQLGMLEQPMDSTSSDFMVPNEDQTSETTPEPNDFSSAFGANSEEPISFGTSPIEENTPDVSTDSDAGDGAFSFGFSGDETPAAESAEETSQDTDGGFSMNFDMGGGDDDVTDSDSSADTGFGMNFNPPAEEPAPETNEPATEGDDDGFSMNFDFSGGDTSQNTEVPADTEAESAPDGPEMFSMNFETPEDDSPEDKPQPDAYGASETDDIVLSFDEPNTGGFADEPTGMAITAAEIQESADQNDDLVFSFDDPVADSPIDETPAEQPGSMYESIELGDINMGTDFPSAPVDDQMATIEMPNPLMDGLDIMTMPGAGTDTPPPPMETEAPTEESEMALGEVLLCQNFTSDEIGAIPTGWTGDECDFAALSVVEDPDGSGDKCLKFEKTEGQGTTTFACKFPDVSGRICIEFDLRCDEKNKHLLGFYIEADSDFRRSVHTVVQCTHPDRPAHLRVFTRPTSYEMAQWARVRYVIDLNDGYVDGYVNGELIAEGVRMGTKTEVLNTLAIRDSAETVGSLLIRNLMVAQVEG